MTKVSKKNTYWLYEVWKADFTTAVDILTDAFSTNATTSWTTLTPKHLSSIFHFDTMEGIKHGYVFATSPKLECVSIWAKSDEQKFSLLWVFDSWVHKIFFNLPIVYSIKLMILNIVMMNIQSKYVPWPHWYLKIIGVKQKNQGKWYARQLFEKILPHMDKDNIPCYLNAKNESNVSFYKKFWFKVIKQKKLFWQYTWAMVRMPKN